MIYAIVFFVGGAVGFLSAVYLQARKNQRMLKKILKDVGMEYIPTNPLAELKERGEIIEINPAEVKLKEGFDKEMSIGELIDEL